MRLRRLREELADRLVIEWRAFPLRPEPDPSVTFQGTYREEAWKRCQMMAQGDGIVYDAWAGGAYPDWSLPAPEAAKCVRRDYEQAVRAHGVRAIPTVVIGARQLRGLTGLAEYRKAVEETGG